MLRRVQNEMVRDGTSEGRESLAVNPSEIYKTPIKHGMLYYVFIIYAFMAFETKFCLLRRPFQVTSLILMIG